MKLHSSSMRLLLRGLPVESQRGCSTKSADPLRPEVVLSEQNRKSFVEKFKIFKTLRTTGKANTEAAVLIPLCMYNGELGFLYTLRSSKLSSNRGQVSFPGGMRDKKDKDFEETALRETWEELKIPKEKVDVWGTGNLVGKQKVSVMPVFGYIGEVDPTKLDINRNEVEEAFVLSLRKMCDPALFRYTQFREGYTLPVYLGGNHRVWGFTGAITHMALTALIPGVYAHKLRKLAPILPESAKTIEKSQTT